jgi:hypothetical protein
LGRYLSVVEVAEPAYLLGLVEDVAVDFHVAHDAEFLEVFEEFVAGDFGGEGDGVGGEVVEEGPFLGGRRGTI